MFRKQHAYLLIALFVAADFALFASRSVYLDEPLFIALSKTPRDYGLFFKDLQWVFFGIRYPMFGGGSHPPAVTYYLAGLQSLFGEFRNVPFRLLYSVFGVAAAFGFYGLAKRRCVSPMAVTLLFLASPAFFVMAPTLMMDVPMLAFLLLGLRFYFSTEERPYQPLLAALCFSLSVLSGYTALVPLACLFVSAILTRQRLPRLAPILAAPIALGLWLVAMLLYYDKNPVAPVVDYFRVINSIAHNVLATPSFLGGVTVFPWLFLLVRKESRRERVAILLASIAAAALLSIFIELWRHVHRACIFRSRPSGHFRQRGFGLASEKARHIRFVSRPFIPANNSLLCRHRAVHCGALCAVGYACSVPRLIRSSVLEEDRAGRGTDVVSELDDRDSGLSIRECLPCVGGR
jgi:hypothetical protein